MRSHHYPETGFYYGEHPDHPGQEGIYVYAQHVGKLENGVASYLPPLERVRKFFPVDWIGRAATLGAAAQ